MSDRTQVDEAPKYVRIITDPVGRLITKWNTSQERLDEYQTVNSDHYDEDKTREIEERQRRHVERTKADFLNALAWRTMWYSLTVVALVSLLLVFQWCEVVSESILTYGLTIEVIGASILGRGLIASPVEILEKSATPYGGPTAYQRKTLAVDVADGLWGIGLIIVGAAISGISTIQII